MITFDELCERTCPFINDRDYHGLVKYLEAIIDFDVRMDVGYNSLVYIGLSLGVEKRREVVFRVEGDNVLQEDVDRIVSLVPDNNPVKVYVKKLDRLFLEHPKVQNKTQGLFDIKEMEDRDESN